MRTLLIIPAYNEQREIVQSLVNDSLKFVNKVLVIDDCSKIKLKLKNAIVSRNNFTKGKGFSLRKGFNYGLRKKYDSILMMDADGEHKPSDIPRLLKKLHTHDFVIGERKTFRSSKRTQLNKWALLWIRFLFPGLKDAYCGFRAIKADKIKKLSLKVNGFEIELEMLLEAYKKRLSIVRISINTKAKQESGVDFQDYVLFNNIFDRWVLENAKYINLGKVKKTTLMIAARLGLFIGRFFE